MLTLARVMSLRCIPRRPWDVPWGALALTVTATCAAAACAERTATCDEVAAHLPALDFDGDKLGPERIAEFRNMCADKGKTGEVTPQMLGCMAAARTRFELRDCEREGMARRKGDKAFASEARCDAIVDHMLAVAPPAAGTNAAALRRDRVERCQDSVRIGRMTAASQACLAAAADRAALAACGKPFEPDPAFRTFFIDYRKLQLALAEPLAGLAAAKRDKGVLSGAEEIARLAEIRAAAATYPRPPAAKGVERCHAAVAASVQALAAAVGEADIDAALCRLKASEPTCREEAGAIVDNPDLYVGGGLLAVGLRCS